jgi:DNA replication protein DnaC
VSRHRRELRERTLKINALIPRMAEIDSEITDMAAHVLSASLSSGTSELGDLQKKIETLSKERIQLLAQNGYDAEYLKLGCDCSDCGDTGFIDGKKCRCYRREEILLLCQNAHIDESTMTLDDFSLSWYDDKIDPTSKKTFREMAERTLAKARAFISDFDSDPHNLFIYGNTGVGKTFISECIARELLAAGHTVLYMQAVDFFEFLAKNTFARQGDDTVTDAQVETVYDCELLIIDDLGTEMTNAFTNTVLNTCIDKRQKIHSSTIFTTNLGLDQIRSRYSERVYSRIMSDYELCKLSADDIRIQKRRKPAQQVL